MIHHVFANRTNIGDWLSARAIQALLGDVPLVEHLCDEPFVDETLTALEQMPDGELVVIGGGGLFMDYFTPFWEGFDTLADRLRFVVWGVGFVDLKQEPSRAPLKLLRSIVDRAEYCVPRDELTRSLLGADRLPEAVPCPSIVAVGERPVREHALLHCANYTTVGAPAYEEMRAVGARFAAQTGRVFRETNNRIDNASEDRLEGVLSLYERSDFVLSSRLHGCIVSLAMRRPVLAVSGDWKVESFMDTADLSDWVLGLDELDQLSERLAVLDQQRSPSEFIAAARAANAAVSALVLKAHERERAKR